MFGNGGISLFVNFLNGLRKTVNAFTIIVTVLVSAHTTALDSAHALDNPPVLLFASAKSGPNDGWPGANGKGASISVWGRNLGPLRADSTLTVCGVQLDSDEDFIEWGATAQPKTPSGISRITFHLTSDMSGSGGVQAVVGGNTSNILSFSISTVGSIYIYPDQSGSNGWSDVDSALESMNPGDFIYFRTGAYSFSEYIGYRLTERNGTEENRITMTAYPGENPTFGPGYLRIHSQYWNFANLHLDEFIFQMGGQRDFCVDAITRYGLRVVGNEFTGRQDHVIQAFGHEFDMLGNYVNVASEDDTSYPFYLCSGNNRNVSYNEIHGGSRWSIHAYDEDRPNCVDQGRIMSDWIIEGNILDATDVGDGFRGALIIQANNVAEVRNITVKNNILYADGSIPSEAMIRIRHNVDGVNIYNNTIHGGLVGVVITDGIPDNIVIKNNIFHNISDYDIKNDGSDGAAELDNNLYESTPVLENISDLNPIVGNAGFVDAGGLDLRITEGSDAIDRGVLIPEVHVDFEGVNRPQLSGYDIGAYEYTLDGAVEPGDGEDDGSDSGGSDGDSGGGCFVHASRGKS